MRLRHLEPRLAVADVERSIAFYLDKLGFTLDVKFPDEKPCFATVIKDDIAVQLSSQPHVKDAAGKGMIWIHVAGVQDIFAALKDRVSIAWGPEVYFYGCRELAITDPDGNMIIFSERTSIPPTRKKDD